MGYFIQKWGDTVKLHFWPSLLLHQGPGPLIFTKIRGNCHLCCALHEPDSSLEGQSRHKPRQPIWAHIFYTLSGGICTWQGSLAWQSPSQPLPAPQPLRSSGPRDEGKLMLEELLPSECTRWLWQQCELLLSRSVVTTHCSTSAVTTTERCEAGCTAALGTTGHARATTVTANYRSCHPGKQATNGEQNRGL